MTESLSLFSDPQFQRPERMRAFKPVYYSTPQWRIRADERKAMDRQLCQGCKRPRRLHAHHLTEQYLGYELPSDLISLCATCHERWHARKLVA